MKKIIINSNEFELPDWAHTFLQSYLDRTKKYITEHNLEYWLYEDIEERISEKFVGYSEANSIITEKDVISTVNEIWESEDIFRDYDNYSNHTGPKDKFTSDIKNSLKKTLYKNPSEWIIFWVCAWLWEFFGINPIWFRIFFIWSLFFFWTWIIIYIILAIILPNKNEDRADIEKNIKNATDKIAEIAQWSNIKEATIKIWSILESIFNLVWKIISAIFFFLLWMFIMAVSLAILFFWSMLRAWFVLDNQNIFEYVPQYAFFFFAIAWVWLFILSIISLAKILKREWIVWAKIVLSIITIVALSGFGIMSAFFETAVNYAQEYSKQSEISFSWTSFSWSEVKLNADPAIKKMKRPFIWNSVWISLYKSADSDIRIKSDDSIRAKNNQKWEEILSKLNPLTWTIENGALTLSAKNENFNSIVPVSFLDRDLEIYVPSDKQLDISGMGAYDFHIKNLKISGEDWMLYNWRYCSIWKLKYSEQYAQFICYPEFR
ncbi:MAG: hypothetical protein ACD_2C00256G0003 [uncultured bacterium (gcode 4)]|uniref:Phage shock protein PspC N-terminal domain-containing protein n=1 Tax=uncultured bacterium (gcode 4) TaxID=1234023 RepID=K2FCZ4_9BACT|nr:MAG: hypothetical protein ACD_2C00256G0003 [uncultured bacterium (gcode 4)]